MFDRVLCADLGVGEPFPEAAVPLPQVLVRNHRQPGQPGQRRRGHGGTGQVGGVDRARLQGSEEPGGTLGLLFSDQVQRDVALALEPVGEEQAERAARLLAALQPSAIYSSDLARAAMTAAPLARLTGLTVISDKDLRERYGGLWEGLTDTEIRAQYPVEHSQWRPPEGETSAVVADRACAALERIADTLTPGTLAVVVSHGAALRLGAARLLGLPEELWGVIGPLANCAWSVLGRRRSRWRLIEHNAGTLPEPVLSDDR